MLGTKYRAWDKISCLEGQNIVLGGTKYRAWRDKISCLEGQNIVLGGTKYRAWGDKISCLEGQNIVLKKIQRFLLPLYKLFFIGKCDVDTLLCDLIIFYPFNRFIVVEYLFQFFWKSLFLLFFIDTTLFIHSIQKYFS